MNVEPEIEALADHAEAAFRLGVLGEIEVGRVLDRQHMTALRRPRRMRRRRLDDFLGRHPVVVKKPAELHLPITAPLAS